MPDKYDITDAELEIMQILWENKECSLNEIIEGLKQEDKNKNTVKTLLRRLILKGSVKSKKTNLRDAVYVSKVSKDKFLQSQNENFVKKLYNGSTDKLLLNFVENKKVSKEELQKLIDILESED